MLPFFVWAAPFFYSLAVFVQIIKYGKPFLTPNVYSTVALTQSHIHFMSVRIISYTTDEQLFGFLNTTLKSVYIVI